MVQRYSDPVHKYILVQQVCGIKPVHGKKYVWPSFEICVWEVLSYDDGDVEEYDFEELMGIIIGEKWSGGIKGDNDKTDV